MSSAVDETLDILLVEDNPGDAQLVRHTLRQVPKLRFKLTQEERLDAAMRRIAEEHFDVILLDLSLPDSRGISTLITALRQAPKVAIVVLTGLDDEAMGHEAVGRGAEDYLVKGEVDGWMLAKAIRYAMERKKVQEIYDRVAEELETFRRDYQQLVKLLPICPACHQPRTDDDYMHQILQFVKQHTPEHLAECLCEHCANLKK